jgi:hypothetical protein
MTTQKLHSQVSFFWPLLLALVFFPLFLDYFWVMKSFWDTRPDSQVTSYFYTLFDHQWSLDAFSAVYPYFRPAFLLYFAAYFLVSMADISIFSEDKSKLQHEFHRLNRFYLFTGVFHFLFIFIDQLPLYYVQFLYPVCVFAIIFVYLFTFSSRDRAGVSEEIMGGDPFRLSSTFKPGRYSVHFYFLQDNKKRVLNIENPFRSFLVVGGAGSGKSFSVIETLYFQFVMKGFVLFNYDYKMPDLTVELQKMLDFRAAAGLENHPHYIINWTDPSRSHRCNPIAPHSISSVSELFSIATIFIKNIKDEWIRKTDFWADSAISFWLGAMLYLYKNHPAQCSIPHAISLCLHNYSDVLDLLLSDEDCSRIIIPYKTAKDEKAGSQLAGMTGSLQIFLSKLSLPEIFWPLSGDDFSLDINDPRDPKHLSLGHYPGMEDYIRPIIGCISQIVKNKILRDYESIQLAEGTPNAEILPQMPCGYMFDELATTYVDRLDQSPNVGRSKKVSTMIGLQLYHQLADNFGSEKAKVLLGSFSNIFIGLINETDTAKTFSDLYGEIKIKVKSVSESRNSATDSSNSYSHSMSYKKEKAVTVDQLTSLPTGYFYGRYAKEFQSAKKNDPADRPFFRGEIYKKVLNDRSQIAPYLKDEKAPCYLKLGYEYTFDEFAVFSESPDIVTRQKAMQQAIQENYDRINNEIDLILTNFYEGRAGEQQLKDEELEAEMLHHSTLSDNDIAELVDITNVETDPDLDDIALFDEIAADNQDPAFEEGFLTDKAGNADQLPVGFNEGDEGQETDGFENFPFDERP